MTTDNTNTTRNDSLAARTDTWFQSFLVWSPGQRDIIKTVALVLMVLDHINLIFQLKQEWMFLAGRGAFPLFALVWGLNLSRHAHIRQPAINRLWGWGIIAQFAYYLAGFPWYEGNILFAFAVAAQVLTWCETRSGWRTAAAILLMALWGPLSGTSYGIAGLLMLAVSHRLYRAEDRAERLALVACLLAVIPALNLATSDDGADRWSGVVCRKIITPFLARGFFPGILRLSSGCAGRSGAVTGVVSLAARGCFVRGRTQHDRAEATGTDTEAENGRGDACPQPENHHQCHHATKVEGEKAEAGRESSPGSGAGGKKSAGQTGAVHLSDAAHTG